MFVCHALSGQRQTMDLTRSDWSLINDWIFLGKSTGLLFRVLTFPPVFRTLPIMQTLVHTDAGGCVPASAEK